VKERFHNLKVQEVEYICDCGGVMRFGGIAFGDPLQYPHTCERCRFSDTFPYYTGQRLYHRE
jgi:hypothetical protein